MKGFPQMPEIFSVWKGWTNQQDYQIQVTSIRRGRGGFMIKYDFLPLLDKPTSSKYEMSYAKWKELIAGGRLREYKDGLKMALDRVK